MYDYMIEIPMKLPSLNEYINECRGNKFAGARMKKNIESDIAYCMTSLPRFKKPIHITFKWVESNRKRDLDNVCFAKKFILDALVKSGHMKDDNRNYVIGFVDEFYYDKESKVILEIKEV